VALTAIFVSIMALVGVGLIVAAVRPVAPAPNVEDVARHAIDWVSLNVWPGSSGVVASGNGHRHRADDRDRAPHTGEREAQWQALLRASNAATIELPFYATPIGRHRRAEAA
jgi:hypothetical protein